MTVVGIAAVEDEDDGDLAALAALRAAWSAEEGDARHGFSTAGALAIIPMD